MLEPIDYTTLEKERQVRTTSFHTKKLPEGVYACPKCYGSGRVTTVYRDPMPNKTGECWTCRGTGEIKKCKHPDKLVGLRGERKPQASAVGIANPLV